MELLQNSANLLLIVLGFGALIFVHELGHFIAAKWAGIRTEAFAIGMGPVICSWRKGAGFAIGSTERKVVRLTGKKPAELTDGELEQHGIGETEYSLRWVPLGGFVKMLGQEDANPNAVSDDPRSYSQCPVGRRMVVVSAGVIMNLITAVVFFLIAFMVGVQFVKPVVGDVSPRMPASSATASNADALGVTEPGLAPGDIVKTIDGKPAPTFNDLQIAAAMGRAGVPIELGIERAGLAEPLMFSVVPERDTASGLQSIGVSPARSSQILVDVTRERTLRDEWLASGLPEHGVEPGMVLTEVNERPVSTYNELEAAGRRADGTALRTVWTHVDDDGEQVGDPLDVTIEVRPQLSMYMSRDATPDSGLLGLTRAMRIMSVADGSPNEGRLQAGDLLVQLGTYEYPRRSQLDDVLQEHAGRTASGVVLREGVREPIELAVTRDGKLGVMLDLADDLLVTADPVTTYARYAPDDPTTIEDVSSPLAGLDVMAGSLIRDVNGASVTGWSDMRRALRDATADAHEAGSGAEVAIGLMLPTPGRTYETVTVPLSATDVADLHALAWSIPVRSYLFEPVYTVRSAGGNPFMALAMGFEETHKMVLRTYLTIDRLFRGSVGVEQLRGPVGIVHLGSSIADKGFMYLLFFLAMISVNLAVLNFLPMPIVDGGLFLFLIYEKFKGRPPSIAFQNVATIIGLCLIGALFLVVTWNDVLRLFA